MIFAICITCYAIVASILLFRKNRELKKVLTAIRNEDRAWNLGSITKRANEVFMAFQDAWSKRDIDIIKPLLSDRLLMRVKPKFDRLMAEKRLPHIENITINNYYFCDFETTPALNRHKFTLIVNYSLIGYYVNEITGRSLTRDCNKMQDYEEYWSFIWIENQWTLDKIQTKLAIGGKIKREYSDL